MPRRFSLLSFSQARKVPKFLKPAGVLVRFAKTLTPFQVALWVVEQSLGLIKVPRVEPEVSLYITISNPDNTVPLIYDISIDSPRAACNEKDLANIQEQIIFPQSDQPNGHVIKLDPELSYNKKDYTADVTVTVSWKEFQGEGRDGGVCEVKEQLNVISELGPKSDYQQIERFASDLATKFIEVADRFNFLFGQ